MKRRVRKVVNFFAFNLLFFALYLNFIHKDKVATTNQSTQTSAAVFNGTTPVENPENYLNKSVPANSEQSSGKRSTVKTSIN